MRVLKDFAIPAGALLGVFAIILGTLAPGHWIAPAIGATGVVLLAAGVIVNRGPILAALRGRKARRATASAGYAVTVCAVLVLVNFLAARHHKRFDLTENKAFSLSEQTTKVLESLPREVTITSFHRDVDPTAQKIDDLLKEYRLRSDRLTTRVIDPDKNPADVRRYNITEYGTLIVESGQQEARTTTADEESLTNAIIKVTRDRQRVVYVTTGHGERDLEDREREGLTLLKGELEKQHYVVKPLILSQGVPADATLVAVPGPRKPFLETESAALGDYLDRGGRLLYLQDPETSPGLGGILGRYGIAVRDDIVVDKVSQIFAGNALIPLVPADGYDEFHTITKGFRYQTFYPLASSLEIRSELPSGVVATKLAQTSPYSWGETSREEYRSGRMTMNEGKDVAGPIVLGAAVSRAVEAPVAPAADTTDPADRPPETRLLVFGDSDFLSNGYFNASGNGDLALNCVAWLAEQEELVSIRPKTSAPRLVILTPAEIYFYFWTIVALSPIVIVVVGVGIWVRRRKL
ncbi:MAG: Gldg family protein [Candidatus Polarisedimenticolia bacterium]